VNDTIEIGRIQYKEFHPIFVIRRLNRIDDRGGGGVDSWEKS
jgi:hypothetical protein